MFKITVVSVDESEWVYWFNPEMSWTEMFEAAMELFTKGEHLISGVEQPVDLHIHHLEIRPFDIRRRT